VADLEEKITPVEDQKEKPTGPTQITVRNNDGSFRQVLKDKAGKFVKKPRAMPETREVTRAMREFLNQKLEADDEGKLIKSSKNRIQQQLENIHRIAINTSGDPKAMMAAIAAFEALHARAHGKVSPGDQELGALERAGVKIVVLTAPELPNSGEIQPREKPTPSFIEAEIIDVKE